jgi:hypothetical protein
MAKAASKITALSKNSGRNLALENLPGEFLKTAYAHT